jgi:hypothetical protein
MSITDAPSHNSTAFGGDLAYSGADNSYGYDVCTAVAAAATKTTAITALQTLGSRVVGVVSDGTANAAAKADLTTAVTATNTLVPPTAWDPSRPAGCASNQCCTGLNGAGVAVNVNGLCPLLFDIASTGAGLGNAAANGVLALLSFGRADIGATIVDGDLGDTIDPTIAFVEEVIASNAPQGDCSGFTIGADKFPDLQFGTPACFDLELIVNATVAATAEPQVFYTELTAMADGTTRLGSRPVYFIVPPEIEDL